MYPLPTHPTHNFTHKNGGNLDTLPGWPKKSHLNIGSGNGLAPGRHQAITRGNVDLLSVGPLVTNFSEMWIKMMNFKKIVSENAVLKVLAILCSVFRILKLHIIQLNTQ